MKLQRHEAADAMPAMTDNEFEELCRSVREHYLPTDPIVMLDGKVLDGWHRYKACVLMKVEPRFVEFAEVAGGMTPSQFVLAKGVTRRHIEWKRRLQLVEKILPQIRKEAEERELAGKADPGPNLGQGRTRETVAELLGVSPNTADAVVKVVENADPAVAKAMAAGDVAPSDAAKVADLPKKKQRKLVKRKAKGEIKTLSEGAKSLEELIAEEEAAMPDEEEATLEEELALAGKQIEHYCRQVVKLAGVMPKILKDEESLANSALAQVKAGMSTARLAKPVLCPKCEGSGCKTCHSRGMITDYRKRNIL